MLESNHGLVMGVIVMELVANRPDNFEGSFYYPAKLRTAILNDGGPNDARLILGQERKFLGKKEMMHPILEQVRSPLFIGSDG